MIKTRRFLLSTVAAAGFAALLSTPHPAFAQTTAQIAIDTDDIGGVVTGPNGPEAGVWVIAETNDLPTRFTRIVVTDDQGRYVLPDLPKAKYTVWVRGYGLVDSPKVDWRAGPAAQSDRGDGAGRCGGGAVLSGDLLVLDAEDSRRRPVRRQERHSAEGQADRLDQPDEEQRLHRLPSARQRGDPHRSAGVRRLQVQRRRLDAPHPVRAGRRADGQHRWPASSAARRTNISATGPTASPRANCPTPSRSGRPASSATSSSPPGTGRTRQALSSRPDLVGQAQPDRQRLRPGLRPAGIRHRRHPDPRSQDQQGHLLQGAGARSGHAGIARPGPCRDAQAAPAVGLLGQRADLGYPHQQSQFDVRQGRAGSVARRRGTRRRKPGVLQEGLRSSLRQAVPA